MAKPKKLKDELAEGAGRLIKGGTDMVDTSISLARTVWKRAKIMALERGITLAKLIEEALLRELKEEEMKKRGS